MEPKNEQTQTAKYFWSRHIALLDLVDLVDNSKLRQKIKTKILDVAHEVNEELNSKEE